MDIATVGASQGSQVLVTLARECGHCVKYIVDDFAKTERMMGIPIIKPSQLHKNYPLVVGLYDNKRRLEFAKDYNVFTLIHPSCYVSPTARIGKGVVVKQGACIGNNVVIGDMCIIDSGVIIEHDSSIGSGSQITVGTVTGGFVEIGEISLVGLGCVLQTKVKIGNNCVICSGSIVFSDVPDNTKVPSGIWLKEKISYDTDVIAKNALKQK